MAIFNTQWYVPYLSLRAVCIVTAITLASFPYIIYAVDNPPPLVLSVTASNSAAVCGDTVEVDIRVASGFVNLSVLEFRVNWDSTLLALIDQEAMDIGADSVFVGDTAGESIYSWLEEAFDGEALSSGALVLRIRFVAINNSGLTNIGINTDPNFFVVLTSGFEDAVLISDDSAEVTTSQLSLTVGQGPTVPFGFSAAVLPYSDVTGEPDLYSIDYSAAAELEGFVDVTDEALLPNEVDLEIPPLGAAGLYEATVLVRNSTTGCSSTPQTFFIRKLTEQVLALKINNPGNDSLSCGDTLCVAVRVDTGFTNLAYLGFSVAWDTSYLSFIEYEADTINSGTLDVGNVLGTVGYSWIDDEFLGVDLPNDSLLLLLKFRVKNANGDPGLVFSDDPAPIDAGNNLFETVSVTTENDVVLTIEGVEIDFSAYTIVGLGVVVAELPFSGVSGNPDVFSIDFFSDAETAGFVDTTNASFNSSPVLFTVPSNAPPGVYEGVIWVSNGNAGCSSMPDTFTIEISPFEQVELFVTGPDDVLCDTFIEINITTGNGVVDLYALQYSVNWLPSQLSLVNVILNPAIDTALVNATDSALVYSLISPDAVTLDSGEVLLTLQMEVISRSGVANVVITDVPQIKEALNTSFGYPPVVVFNQVAIDLTPVGVTPDTALVVCQGTATVVLAYTDALNAPDQYSIDFDSVAESNGFVDVVWDTLPPSPIIVELPTNATSGVYQATVQVKNVLEDCASVEYPISITVNETPEAADLSASICSDDTLAIDLQGQITNGALNVLFTWSAMDNPDVSGETLDTSFVAFISDTLVNTSNVPQTVVYTITPSGGAGCPGMPFEVMVTVNPTPVLDVPMNPIRVCSDEELDYDLETGVPAAFDIISVTIPNALTPATGNATFPAFNVGADYLAADAYTNLAPGGRLVAYQVIPVSEDGCVGDTGTVVFRILSEPQMQDAKDTVCAGEPIGLEFGVISGSFQADGYELVSVALDTGLTAGVGNAVPGECLDSSAIAQDVFFNPNNAVLNVVYIVRPLRGCVQGLACSGDTVAITICIQPAPAGVDPEPMICSADTLDVDLSDLIANNVGGLTFEWFAIDNDSVIGEANGLQNSSLINDALINISNNNQTVVYCIIPTEGFGCTGDTFKVTTTIRPIPVLFEPVSPITACSDEILNYDLTVDGASVPASTFDIVSVLINSPLIADAGNATVPAFNVGADYLAADAYTNLSPGGRLVEYQVIPVSEDGCVGDTGTVVFRILAEPRMEDVKDTVCTGDPIGVELGVMSGSFRADGYELMSVTLDAGLTADAGNAAPGVCLDSSAIAQDVFFNPNNAVLNAVYTVRPLRGCVQGRDCAGDTVTITICVSPAPQGENNTVEICAVDTLAVDLSATINNGITATNFTWFALTDNPDVSGETLAPVQSGFISDVLINTGAETDTVLYEVTAVGIGGCAGQPWYISVLVHPLPELFVPADDPNICSDAPLGSNFGGFAAAPGSVLATSFVVDSVNIQAQLTASSNNLTLPFGPAPGDAVNGDVYTNLAGGARRAVYSVTPISEFGCTGESTAFSFQIRAEPQMAPDTIEVCSNETLDYVLNTIAGSFAANGYELIAVVADSSLIAGAGNATAGPCQPDTLLKNDTWYNPTTDALTVVYTVRPQRGCPIGNPAQDCNGDSVELVVSVSGQPQPVCPSDIEVVTSLDSVGDCQTDFTLNHPVLNGVCSPVSLVIGFDAGDPAPDSLPIGQSVVPGGADMFNFEAGETIITYTVTDGFSNTGTCSFTVMVTDDETPEISCPSSDTINTDPGLCVAINPGFTAPTTSDNCGVEGVVDNAPDTLQSGTTLIVYTVSDEAGNTASCSQTVVVEDDEAPEISCPTSDTISTDPGLCVAVNPGLAIPTAADNCGVDTLINDAPGTLPLGTTVIVYTVSDEAGNTASCAQTVVVEDDEAPEISCPPSDTISTDPGLCVAINPSLSTPTTTDNCGVDVLISNVPDTLPLGTTVIVYTVSDEASNTASCSQTVVVEDDEAPEISCPPLDTISTDPGLCVAISPGFTAPTTSDNCGVEGVMDNAPDTLAVGVTLILFTVSDQSGNTAVCTQTVVVEDDEAPVIACSDTLEVNTDPASCFAFGVSLPEPTTTDNCSAVTVTNNAPTQLSLGFNNVTYTATDQSGNSAFCSLIVEVRDNEPPTIECPDDVDVNTLQGLCYATTVPLDPALVNDNCPNLVVVNNAPILYLLGPTNLTYTVTDAGGNTATCITVVTVIDNQPPVIICPANATVNANANCQATGVNIGLPQVTENCTVSSISNNAPTAFPVGTTQVVFTVTDNSGNTGTCVKTVTVVDNTPPTIVCPGNITASTAPGLCTAAQVTLGNPIVNDNCPGAGFSLDVPTTYPLGTTVVLYTATDNSGNTATCTQQVAVTDLQPPVIICPTAITLNTDPSACTSTNPPIGMATASDNCVVDTVFTNKPGVFALGATVIFYQAVDVNGNSASCTQSVTVIDQEKPLLTACPANISVTAPSGVCTATVSWNPPVATDNCTNLQTTSTHQPGAVFQVGPTTVVYTATDVGNNSAVCSFVVTVRDQTPPVLSACPGNINVGNAPNACGANVSWTPPTASDNCGTVVLTTNHNPGAFFGIGQTNVVYTATDASGNTAVCTFSIRVNDTQAPTLICPANITVNTPANDCFAPATWTIPTPADNCQGAVISNATHQPGSSFQLGTTTVRYNAVDAAGTSTSCSFTVTVVDNVPPKVVCVPTFTINLNGNGIATLNPVLLNAGSTDNCGISAYTAQPELFTCTQVGVQVVTLVVSDNAGNTASCTTTISVNASPVCTPPVIGNSGGPNIHDPCFCIGNGRFSEEVVIGPAGSGQAWRVSSTTLINPSTSLPYPVGTLFTEIPLGGGLSQYVLAGVHIDGVGYTVAAQSPFYPGTTLSIGNTCSYPDLTIVAGDQGPYCQFTAPVTFTGSANGGIAGIGQFLVDNVPVPTSQNPPNSGNWVAVVNVGSLSAGSHTLTFNFDAGNPAGQLPPANIGCTATENLIFDVSPAPSVLVCKQLTTVVLGGTCLETITPDEVLSTAVGCVDDYIVTIVGPNGQIGNTVNGLNIGQALTVTVTNLVNGSSCAGDLDVIDISGPDLVCPDVFVPCILTDTDPLMLLNLSIPNAFPTATDNCSAVNDFDYADQLFDLGCSATINNQTNMSAYILRTWTARDEYGNSGQCQQFVYLQRLPVSQVQFPPNTSVSCAEVADPDITGTPFVTVGGTVFPVYPDAGICELTAVYTDVVLPGTGCNTQTIQRTWSVFGTCQPGSVSPPNFNPRLLTQVIQVTDNTGPEVDCPADITANANSGNCCASVNLPDVVVSDPCSRVKSARALVIRIDPQTGDTLFVFTVAGALTNFPGNDPQDPDTLASYGTTTCLPIGQYRIVYLAEDVCGNIGSCAFNLRVGDMTPPNAVCAAVQSVTLNAQGQASLNATAFNNGSTDNCGAVAFKARRLDAALCQGNNQFFDNVLFCCEDVGDTAFVVLRVYDVPVPVGPVALNFEQVHATDCVARVLVRDTVAPTCVAPNDTVVTCGTYSPDLDKFSDASASDNCCLDTLLETLDLAQFDTICKRGIIQRTFTAVDCDGNSSVCRQNIQFDYIQTYVIQFPDDVVAPACGTSGLFGEPEFFLNNCENLDVSFTDVSVPGPSGLCSRVERTWRIVNLCTYVPTLPLTVVPNPQPDDDPIFADNLPGPIVSPLNTPSPWMPTVVALTPGAQPTNFSQYWSSNSNGYAYIQYIYVVDDIDPVAVTACPTDTVRIGDASTNDPGLWNASFWFDPLNTSNDLCEATAALSFSAEDNCGGNLLDLRYELFLDLDGNGTQETVVKSDSLPAVNTVRFNNLASGNVNGGTARAFDQRGLAVNQQYRFALEKTVVGNQATAQVRWNTTAAANVYSAPQLPNGIHRIRWIAEDACGNSSSCEYVFTLRDTLPPTLVCQGGTFNLGPGGVYNLLTSSLFSSATDNCTPQNKLNFSMRIVGSGNGFPLNPQGFPVTQLAFDCGDLGTQNIELWVADAAFNTRVCTTAVIIDDAVGFCSSTFYDVGGNIKNDKLVNYEGAEMSVSGMHPSGFAFTNTDVTGTDGNYLWSNIAPDGAMYTVKPFADDNPLNGVFTSDLVFIQNHILQKDTLDTPYRVIAADANKSGAVTGLDITEIRKLILGINSKFPKNTSWRFVDKTWVFNNILNPFNPVFPETITIDPATMDELTLDFVALKVGDANGSALPNNLVSIDDRTAGQMAFEVETDEPIGDRQLLVGETVLVRIRPAEPVAGYQFTLSHAGLELLELLPGVGMTLDHFGVFPDKAALTTSWDGKTGGTFELRLRVLEPGQLSDLLRVSGSITPAQAYRSINERPLGVALSFSETGLVQVPDFELYQNRPNPFNGVTWIGFYLPEATVATLRILDETGRLVYMRHAEFDKGEQYITLTADELGATGMMYYELTTPTNRAVKKMVRVER